MHIYLIKTTKCISNPKNELKSKISKFRKKLSSNKYKIDKLKFLIYIKLKKNTFLFNVLHVKSLKFYLLWHGTCGSNFHNPYKMFL